MVLIQILFNTYTYYKLLVLFNLKLYDNNEIIRKLI